MVHYLAAVFRVNRKSEEPRTPFAGPRTECEDKNMNTNVFFGLIPNFTAERSFESVDFFDATGMSPAFKRGVQPLRHENFYHPFR